MLQKYKSIKKKSVHTSLVNKYSNNFHFYFSKSINEIIYNDTKSPINNAIKDLIMMSDETEYLNRIYNYYNAVGKEEIFDRIRLISGNFLPIQDSIAKGILPLIILWNILPILSRSSKPGIGEYARWLLLMDHLINQKYKIKTSNPLLVLDFWNQCQV